MKIKITNESLASNKSQVSVNDDMINMALNETFTNGYLDFSEADEDDDISMTCEFVTEFNDKPKNKVNFG